VRVEGFEPPTYGVSDRCANQIAPHTHDVYFFFLGFAIGLDFGLSVRGFCDGYFGIGCLAGSGLLVDMTIVPPELAG
jgi:hypothetical protein